MGDSHVGLQARLMSQALRKLTGGLNHDQHHDDLHQPAAREDRRVLRLARDHRRRQGAEVLRVGAPRHPSHRDAEGRHRRGRQPHARQGRQEQDGAAVQAGRVRHPVRHRHLPRGQPHRLRRRARASSRSRAPGTPTTASSSARARRTPATSCIKNADVAAEIESKIKAKLGIGQPKVVEARRPPTSWPRAARPDDRRHRR